MTQEAVALSRKYRPRNFQSGFVGQEYTIKMIKNALDENRLGNSILLSGERGCGKTSTARIIAKGLNCETGNKSEPCGSCSYCQDEHMLINEIDAASNRGIDSVRSLKDSIRYATPPGKYKVYIIDEVHMMTTESFNALLKTLEEPPENVVFILCTTDPEKLLATIISRMSHFKFRKVPIDKLVAHLKYVLEQEGAGEYTDEGLTVIAQQANGGIRDSLTILEQCLLLNEKLTANNVYKIIGKVDNKSYLNILLSIHNNDLETALTLTRNLINDGVQTKYFYEDFIKSVTNLISNQLYTDEENELSSQLTFNHQELLAILKILQEDMKSSFVELSVIKVFHLDFIQNKQPVKTNVSQPNKEDTNVDNNSSNETLNDNATPSTVSKPSYLAQKVFSIY